MANEEVNTGRRRFLTATTAVVGAVGAGFAAVPFIKSWSPSARARFAGAPVSQDIGALAEGSRVRSPEAPEASHLFFGDAVGHLLGIFATHPPLVERIRRIDPSFDGDSSRVRVGTAEPSAPDDRGAATLRPQVRPGRGVFRLNPEEMVSRIGTIADPAFKNGHCCGTLYELPVKIGALPAEMRTTFRCATSSKSRPVGRCSRSTAMTTASA